MRTDVTPGLQQRFCHHTRPHSRHRAGQTDCFANLQASALAHGSFDCPHICILNWPLPNTENFANLIDMGSQFSICRVFCFSFLFFSQGNGYLFMCPLANSVSCVNCWGLGVAHSSTGAFMVFFIYGGY